MTGKVRLAALPHQSLQCRWHRRYQFSSKMPLHVSWLHSPWPFLKSECDIAEWDLWCGYLRRKAEGLKVSQTTKPTRVGHCFTETMWIPSHFPLCQTLLASSNTVGSYSSRYDPRNSSNASSVLLWCSLADQEAHQEKVGSGSMMQTKERSQSLLNMIDFY